MTLDFELIDTDAGRDFDFAACVGKLRAAGWTGVTVTHPHKTQAAYVPEVPLPPALLPIGAANTLVFGPPGAAHNTDRSGFLGLWETEMGDSGPGAVAMAGAGGVARALASALQVLGALDITVWDVAPGRAEALAADIGSPVRAIGVDMAGASCAAADGLVNATALGMAHAPGMAFAPAWIGGQAWAFEAIYAPTRTTFLEAAAVAGLRTLTGFDLFRHMAIRSFAAYTGIAPDPADMLPRLAALAPDY
jgi:shikimate dehydrogenase